MSTRLTPALETFAKVARHQSHCINCQETRNEGKNAASVGREDEGGDAVVQLHGLQEERQCERPWLWHRPYSRILCPC